MLVFLNQGEYFPCTTSSNQEKGDLDQTCFGGGFYFTLEKDV